MPKASINTAPHSASASAADKAPASPRPGFMTFHLGGASTLCSAIALSMTRATSAARALSVIVIAEISAFDCHYRGENGAMSRRSRHKYRGDSVSIRRRDEYAGLVVRGVNRHGGFALWSWLGMHFPMQASSAIDVSCCRLYVVGGDWPSILIRRRCSTLNLRRWAISLAASDFARCSGLRMIFSAMEAGA